MKIKSTLLASLCALAMAIGTVSVPALAAETGEAQINGKAYDTFAEAAKAVQPGETIELLADLQDIGTVAIPQNAVVDGKNCTISGDSALSFAGDTGGTVQNVNFRDIHNAKNEKSAIYCSGLTAALTVQNCTFDNVDWDCLQTTPKADTASVTVTGCTFKNSSSQGQRFIHIESQNSGGAYADLAFSANITNNKFYGTAQNLSQEALEVYFFSAPEKVDLSKNYYQDPAKVYITSSSKERTSQASKIYPLYRDEAMEELYSPAACVLKNVSDMAPAAYDTLARAVDAAESGQTVVLLQDTAEDGIITIDQELTLQLNGHTITNNVKKERLFHVTAPVQFTIDGTAAGSGMEIPAGNTESYGFVKIMAEADVTLQGGNYTGNTDNGAFVKISSQGEEEPAPTASVTFDQVTATTNRGVFNMDTADALKLAVTGGSFTATDPVEKGDTYNVFGIDSISLESPLIFEDVKIRTAGGAGVENAGGAATYTNCDIAVTHTSDPGFTASAVACSWGGTATINGGSYQSAGYGIYVYSSGGAMTVKDGTIQGGLAAARADVGYEDAAAVINIEGGHIDGALQTNGNTEAKIAVSGGTFTQAVPDEYCADGYAPADNGDGTFGVVSTATLTAAGTDSGKKPDGTGVIRFITKVEKLDGTPTSYGAWILPLDLFEKDGLTGARMVEYTAPITAGKTYAADLTGIPADEFPREVYAQAYMYLNGIENPIICKFGSVSVGDNPKELAE